MNGTEISAVAAVIKLLFEHQGTFVSLVVILCSFTSLPSVLMWKGILAHARSLQSLSDQVAASQVLTGQVLAEFNKKYDGTVDLLHLQAEHTDRFAALLERVTKNLTRLEESLTRSGTP